MLLASVFSAGAFGAPSFARAQSASPPVLSIDLALGGNVFTGDPYASTSHGGGEVVIGTRLLRRPYGSLVAGVLGLFHPYSGDDPECREVPSGPCGPTRVIPRVGLLLGGEIVRANTALRLTGGPLRYSTSTDYATGGTRSRSVAAVHARMDVAYPAAAPIGLTMSASTRHLGTIDGQRLTLIGGSIGVRVQR